MKEKISYIAVNLGVLLLLVIGGLLQIELLTAVAVIILWATAVGGTILLTIPEKFLNLIDLSGSPFSNSTDVLYDIVVVTCLVLFGYVWLPALYILHMGALLRINHYSKKEGNA